MVGIRKSEMHVKSFVVRFMFIVAALGFIVFNNPMKTHAKSLTEKKDVVTRDVSFTTTIVNAKYKFSFRAKVKRTRFLNGKKLIKVRYDNIKQITSKISYKRLSETKVDKKLKSIIDKKLKQVTAQKNIKWDGKSPYSLKVNITSIELVKGHLSNITVNYTVKVTIGKKSFYWPGTFRDPIFFSRDPADKNDPLFFELYLGSFGPIVRQTGKYKFSTPK